MLKSALKAIFSLLYRVEVKDCGAPLHHEKTLIIANHESLLDGVLVGLFMPHDATYVVHTEVAEHWLYKRLLKNVPHLPVSPSSPMAMKQVYKLVDSGRPVVIFPEGRRSRTGALEKVYSGPAFIAARTKATVIPVRIEGAKFARFFAPKQTPYPRKFFPRLSLSIQAPCQVTAPEEGKASERRRIAGHRMTEIMQTSAVEARPRETLFNAFLRARENFGGGYVLMEDARRYDKTLKGKDKPKPETYNSLLRTALGVSRLVSRMTEPGECVGVVMPNVTTTVGLFLGMSACGRVPAMLNYTAGPSGLQSACHTAQIKQIFTSRKFLEKANLTHLVADIKGVKVHYAEDLKGNLTPEDKKWIFQSMLSPSRAFDTVDHNDNAVVLFTSGSEGKPKGVVHTHDSILANVAQIRAMADFVPQDKFMVCLPLFHSFGFTAGTMLPLVSGFNTFLFPSPLHYREIPETSYDRGCTVLFGTSTFLQNYAKRADDYDFSQMRYVIAGAEKLADSVRQTWADRFGIRIMEGYGATECAPVISVNTRMFYRKGSVGKAAPGTELRVVPVPGIDRGGLLLVRGPQVMKGYLLHDNPGVVVPTAYEGMLGWYSTGDIVEIDADGYIFILGRLKRFAKIGGEMVSLEVVEFLAQQSSLAAQHAVVNIPDKNKGEALVVFSTDPNLDVRSLQATARELGIPELAVPRKIVREPVLPMLGVKIDYVSLKSKALSLFSDSSDEDANTGHGTPVSIAP